MIHVNPNFEKLNKEFEKYSKSLFFNSVVVSIILIFVLFIILFIRLLYIELDTQSERIKLNSAIINDKFSQINDYINLIKNSYIEFYQTEKAHNQSYHVLSKLSYKDKLGRYIYNSLYSGTYISLYKPISGFPEEFSGLEYISTIAQNQRFDFLLWSYYYSKNKFVYVHPYLPDPVVYHFSEKSYEGDILKNTMLKKDFYISPVYKDKITGRMIFSIATPIYNENVYQGTFAFDIDLFRLFKDIKHLNNDTENMSLFLVNSYNQYFSFDNVNKKLISDYKKIKNENFDFSFRDFKISTSYNLMWNNTIVCSFPVVNIFYKTLFNPSLLYFIFVVFMFYIFMFVMYFRFMKPLQKLIIDILNYLTIKKFDDQTSFKKIKRFGYKKNLINEIQSTFLFLVKQFSLKIKIDNDIKISQDLLKYFINNECSSMDYSYVIKPAFNFSGDYVRVFDIKKSPEDELVTVSKIFFIADVSGKGMGAILIVNQLNLFFDIHAHQIWDLNSFEEILNKFNQYFLEKNKNCDFIAFRALYIDSEKKETFVIDAGLPESFCIDSLGNVEKIPVHNSFTPLGISESEVYQFSKIDVSQNQRNMILCTDGILEQTNKKGEIYEERFVHFLKNKHSLMENHQDFIQTIWKHFYSFMERHENQRDDFTVLLIKLV